MKIFIGCIKNAINFGFDTDSHAAISASLGVIKYKIPGLKRVGILKD